MTGLFVVNDAQPVSILGDDESEAALQTAQQVDTVLLIEESDDANTAIGTTTDESVGDEDLLKQTSNDETADELFVENFDGNLLDDLLTV